MRRRITRALLATAAAGATIRVRLTLRRLAVAGAAIGMVSYSAAASTALLPPPAPVSRARAVPTATAACSAEAVAGCTLAGYRASGTGFRYAQAVITIPDGPGSAAVPRFYVALRGRLAEARAGVFWDSRTAAWEVFAGLWRWGYPVADQAYPLPAASEGRRAFVSMYYDQAHDTMIAVLRLPGGISYRPAFAAHHARYPQALAVANWKSVSWGAPGNPAAGTRLTRFLHGRFTTLRGQRGTFAGPWKLTRFVIVGSYVAPHTWLVSSPSRLWAHGVGGRSRPANAFGVWLYRRVMP